MTTLLFTAEPASTVMRLLDFGEASSGGLLTRLPVEASAAVNTSSLSLTFGHFNDSFLFDPDFGLLVGRKAGSGSDDNVGLIVGVVVAVAVAVAFVGVVIAGGLGVAWWQGRRRTLKAVNFGVEQVEESL
ncbi:uncharacterized protein ACA1_355030 [Acanthamoeba castellanii str. Neff]|nr:uncharacterized protein ACA1_355030 [Acanthamoeba castellanii str. Neff]ELR14351.1 hypothetical protein ACA1_355030 [Acanthamoeba castellanii str. Neff]